MNIGALCGCVLLALLFDILGRKPILLLGAVLVFSSWILIGVATSVGVLAFGRVVGGLGQGISIPVSNHFSSQTDYILSSALMCTYVKYRAKRSEENWGPFLWSYLYLEMYSSLPQGHIYRTQF
ncbi:hypothetical protein PPYR_13657 [Photinus pyralis]|uniref:Major facilitator superfamily (MFS) profile domain-containing protein n=1 Tax=Photinus pyralis TaxID=7054 RepID=A0A5N4A9Q1_PHOPY|nr:hypothetical protein PPYR_13657 [Photinus pyralis]